MNRIPGAIALALLISAPAAHPAAQLLNKELGPDGAKVELVMSAEKDAPPPIKHHHVHFINKQYVEMRNLEAFCKKLKPKGIALTSHFDF